MNTDEGIWTLPVAIEKLYSYEVADIDSDNDGSYFKYNSWEIGEVEETCKAEIPYIGEEDEIQEDILLPAIESYLREFKFIYADDVVHFTGSFSTSYVVKLEHNDQPIYRLVIG